MLIRGKCRWAKIVGAPVWGFEKTFREWTVDVYIDDKTAEKLAAEGLKDIIKDKGDGKFVAFRRKELKKDGTPNKPIRIVDAKGEEWGKQLIGNGSTVNVNFAVNEYKPKKFSANILSLQVWEHVSYTGGEFPIKEDDGTENTEADDWSKEVED